LLKKKGIPSKDVGFYYNKSFFLFSFRDSNNRSIMSGATRTVIDTAWKH
jgi:hypothetical protein